MGLMLWGINISDHAQTVSPSVSPKLPTTSSPANGKDDSQLHRRHHLLKLAREACVKRTSGEMCHFTDPRKPEREIYGECVEPKWKQVKTKAPALICKPDHTPKKHSGSQP